MGKTTNKNALSFARTQGVQIPGSDGARRGLTNLNLCASARPAYTNVGPKLGPETYRIFSILFKNFPTDYEIKNEIKSQSYYNSRFNFTLNSITVELIKFIFNQILN